MTQGHGHRLCKGRVEGQPAAAQHHAEGGKAAVHGDKVGSSASLGRQRLVPGTLADAGRCWSHRVPILGSAGEGQQAPRADNIAAFDSKASESLPRRGSIWLPGSAGGVSSFLSKGGSEGWDGAQRLADLVPPTAARKLLFPTYHQHLQICPFCWILN